MTPATDPGYDPGYRLRLRPIDPTPRCPLMNDQIMVYLSDRRMASPIRSEFLSSLEGEFGRLQRIGTSSSLFAIREKARVYVRYSKLHKRGSTFFGLRQADIALLEGFPSFIAFLWEGQTEPLLEYAGCPVLWTGMNAWVGRVSEIAVAKP